MYMSYGCTDVQRCEAIGTEGARGSMREQRKGGNPNRVGSDTG